MFRWQASTGMVGLADLPGGGVAGHPTGMSADGAVIVGASSHYETTHATMWDAAGNAIFLTPGQSGYHSSTATDVSADGRVVVGYRRRPEPFGYDAFRWTPETGHVFLPLIPGPVYDIAIAQAISDDGRYIYGHTGSRGLVRWSDEEGLVELDFFFDVNGCNADGTVMVGENGSEHRIWSACRGVRNLAKVIEDYGVDMMGYRITETRDVSADGTQIVGWSVAPPPDGDFEAFLLILPPEVPGEMPGDLDADGVIGPRDADGMGSAIQGPHIECLLCPAADIAGNGILTTGGSYPAYAPEGRVDLRDYAQLQRLFVPPCAVPSAADLDGDCAVDGHDAALFGECMFGPQEPSDCAYADFDADGDVDLADFAAYQREMPTQG